MVVEVNFKAAGKLCQFDEYLRRLEVLYNAKIVILKIPEIKKRGGEEV